MGMMDIILMFIQVMVVISIAPLFDGFVRVLRAKFQSRRGPPDIFQTYRDIIKTFKRSETLPENASWVFRLAPYMMFAVAAALVAAIPITYSNPKLGMFSDLFVIVYLSALLRFVFGVASLDSGSTFAAIGGSREQMIAVFVEPTLILSALVVVLLAKSTNLITISHLVQSGAINYFIPAFSVAAVAFLWATYVETGKNPYDLPEAEQELLEGLLSEYSGRRLAIAHGALVIKQFAMIGLFFTLFSPWPVGVNPFLSLVAFIVKVGLFYIFAAFVESFYSRYRLLQKMRKTAAGALILAVLSLVFYVVGGYK